MKKKKIMMAGILALTATLGSNIAYAVNSENDGFSYKLEEQNKVSIFDYFKEFNFLGLKEKRRLSDMEKQAEPHYEKIEKIESKIDDITDDILKDSDTLYDEIENIKNVNKPLWDKLYAVSADEQYTILGTKDLIKKSKVLNGKEKEILLKDQEKIEMIERELNKRYEEIEKKTENLRKESDGIYEKIREIEDKTSDIWDKFKEPIKY